MKQSNGELMKHWVNNNGDLTSALMVMGAALLLKAQALLLAVIGFAVLLITRQAEMYLAVTIVATVLFFLGLAGDVLARKMANI